MANMQKEKHPMPTRDPKERAKNFYEVALGYSEETAIAEAMRCLNCKNMPCVSGCPVKIHIPQFIEKIQQGEFLEAYKIISESSSLPAVCGRAELSFCRAEASARPETGKRPRHRCR